MHTVLLVARWVQFASVMALFGAPAFLLYAIPPGATADGDAARRAVGRLTQVAAPLAAASALLWAGASVIDITDDPWSVLDGAALSGFLLETGFGRAWLVRFALLALLLALCRRARMGPVRAAVVTAGAGALLVTQAWLGHAAAGTGAEAVALVAAYALHLLGAGAWLGGLLPLAALMARWRRATDRGMALQAGPTLRRFSRAGIAAVLLVAAGGAVSAALHLGSAGALVGTFYGRLLLAKAALFCAMLGLAARNRTLARGLARDGRPWAAVARILWNSRAELVAGAAALALAALLGLSAPDL